jgi:hypothetical protein
LNPVASAKFRDPATPGDQVILTFPAADDNQKFGIHVVVASDQVDLGTHSTGTQRGALEIFPLKLTGNQTVEVATSLLAPQIAERLSGVGQRILGDKGNVGVGEAMNGWVLQGRRYPDEAKSKLTVLVEARHIGN